MKALLLRVGIDSQYHALSPVWPDYTYKYIPIYYKDLKEKEKNETRTYIVLGLEDFIPKKNHNKLVHLDPEFKSMTYGEPGRQKRKSLLDLKKNDLLVFYLGGKLLNDPKEKGCFIFAYFFVDKIYDWNKLNEKEKKDVALICKNNAHIRSSKSKNNLVIVKGNEKSKQLAKCIQISEKNQKSKNPPYIASKEMKQFIGIREAIMRAVPISIKEEKYVENLKLLLGLTKYDPEKFEGKIPFTIFARIVDEDKTLKDDEKLFLKNFMINKGNNYKEAADNFGNDVYTLGNYKNTELMEEYFIKYFNKIDN